MRTTRTCPSHTFIRYIICYFYRRMSREKCEDDELTCSKEPFPGERASTIAATEETHGGPDKPSIEGYTVFFVILFVRLI